MATRYLTRGEAEEIIREAEGNPQTLRDLHEDWLGNRYPVLVSNLEPANELSEMLFSHVADCCDADDERSNGPQDSDLTNIQVNS